MVGSRKQVGPQTVPGPWEWLHAGGKGTSGSGTWIPTEEAGGPPPHLQWPHVSEAGRRHM